MYQYVSDMNLQTCQAFMLQSVLAHSGKTSQLSVESTKSAKRCWGTEPAHFATGLLVNGKI